VKIFEERSGTEGKGTTYRSREKQLSLNINTGINLASNSNQLALYVPLLHKSTDKSFNWH
jgi:hypothetical protein